MNKKLLSALVCGALALTLLTGCSTESAGSAVREAAGAVMSVVNGTETLSPLPDVSDITADTVITFSGTGAVIEGGGANNEGGMVEIDSPGVFRLTGTADSRVVVDTSDEGTVTIILDDCALTSTDNEALYFKSAENAVVLIAEGTENTLTSGTAPENGDTGDADEDASGAALRAKCSLSISGGGSLTVNGYLNNGISANEALLIDGGTILVNAANDGVKSKTNVTVSGGTLTVDSSKDAIQADGALTISGGSVDILTGTGAESADMKVSDTAMMGGGFGGGPGGGDQGRGQGRDQGQGGQPGGQGQGGQPGGQGQGGQPGGQGQGGQPGSQGQGGQPGGQGQGGQPGGQGQGSQPGGQGQGGQPGGQGQGGGERRERSSDEAEVQPGQNENASGDAEANNGASGESRSDASSEERGSRSRDNGFSGPGMQQDRDETASVSRKGLKAGGDITISGGSVTIDTEDDGIHGDADVNISGGEVVVYAGDDGIHADSRIRISGGSTSVLLAYEGFEAKCILIEDGVVNIVANDDGMNVNGGNGFGFPGASSEPSDEAEEETASEEAASDEAEEVPAELRITGGLVMVDSGGDGLDSNGSLYIEGGEVYVSGPSTNWDAALDTGDGSDYELLITGGTVMAGGYSGMMESPENGENAQGFIYYTTSGYYAEDGALCELKDSSGNVILSYNFAHSYNCVVLSSPEIRAGETYTLTIGDQEFTIEMTSNSYSTRGQRGGNRGGSSREANNDASGEAEREAGNEVVAAADTAAGSEADFETRSEISTETSGETPEP